MSKNIIKNAFDNIPDKNRNRVSKAESLDDLEKVKRREQIAQSLVEHYYSNFCEDPINETNKDIEVIKHIRKLEVINDKPTKD